MTESPDDRRRFIRIAFDAQTELSQDANVWPVKLVDLSLKGLLIERPASWPGDADPEKTFIADVHLSEEVDVQMEVQLSHVDESQLGFVCVHIGLESITHLRRLIELNLGDETELERELGALIKL